MKKAIQTTKNKDYARRLIEFMQLHEGKTIVDVCRISIAARSSVGRWIDWFAQGGMDALHSLPVGRPSTTPVREMCAMLTILVQFSPQDFGYQRSRWSTELLTMQFNDLFQSTVAASTVRRWLPKVGIVWRRAAPTLNIRDPEKDEKLAQISEALDKCGVDYPVFYEDEVYIDLNPKIGADWAVKGQQK